MNKPYANWTTSPTSPARMVSTVTPNDTVDLSEHAKALRVWNPTESSATVSMLPAEAEDGAAPTTLSFPPGLTIEPVATRRVRATGTTSALVIHSYSR